MSSPFMTTNPNRSTVSSPGPNSRDPQDVAVRPMRLKVLYTFDSENKTNCLTRWHQVLQIRTAYLDANTQIGVVELKTCLKAIVTASPELVAKLGQDYTVYTFDYSEYDTPLVGQGMLSWELASPVQQGSKLVTGRVCNNIMGLFSAGVQETLEVKIRLVPVPTCLQSEYIESLCKYRDISRIMPGGFDAQAWTNFVKDNPSIMAFTNQSRSQSPAATSMQRDVGIEHVQRLMMNNSGRSDAGERSSPQRRGSFANDAGERDSSRAGEDSHRLPDAIGQQRPQQSYNRPLSRVSVQSFQGRDPSRRNSSSTDLGYVSNEDQRDDGPTRKRAKVMKADWPGRSNITKQTDSLRVAASTAASIRVLQPTAVRPSSNPVNSLEEPPRVPTPVPKQTNQTLRPMLPAARSCLGRESFSASNPDYHSPYSDSEPTIKRSESTTTSPEALRGRSFTPAADPASSPPVIRDFTPAPSSPMLPALPRHNDSGFMSGSIDDLFEDLDDDDDDDDENRPLDEEDIRIAAQYERRTNDTLKEAGSKPQLDRAVVSEPKIPLQEPVDEAALIESRKQARRAVVRRESTASSSGPVSTGSNPRRRAGRTLNRSQTWSGQHASSDAPMGSDGLEAPRTRRSGWNNAQRKHAIQSKLADSIAAGEMPPFCENCGAIETPTWRKAYTKVHCGSAALVRIGKEDGAIVGWHELEQNEDGTTRLFKIFKKTLLESDEGFTEILMCNPCGLWLSNHKGLRPRKCWEQAQKRKNDKDDKPKRGGGSRKRKPKTNADSDNSTGLTSEATPSQPDASSPMEGVADEPPVDENEGNLELPTTNRRRAASVQLPPLIQGNLDPIANAAAITALQRAVQSSPAGLRGSKDDPISLDDLSPKPTRRVLFPSPRNSGSLITGCINVPSRKKGEGSSPFDADSPLNPTGDQANKENVPPSPTKDPFQDLFDPDTKAVSCPSTPTPSNRSLPDPFKTPNRITPNNRINTNDFFSSAAKAFLHPPKTPSRTPSKQSQYLVEMTPFTRHLNTLLSEADLPGMESPSQFIDFPLPSSDDENAIGPSSTKSSRAFRSTEFDFSGFASTDIPMPSSPPGWFGVYEDPTEGAEVDEVGWGMLEFGSSPLRRLVGVGDEVPNGAVPSLAVKTEETA